MLIWDALAAELNQRSAFRFAAFVKADNSTEPTMGGYTNTRGDVRSINSLLAMLKSAGNYQSETKSKSVIKMSENKKPLSAKKRKYMKALTQGKTKKAAALEAGYSESVAIAAKSHIETPDFRAAFRDTIRKHVPMDKVGQRIAEGLDAMETKFATWEGKITDSSDVVAWSERRSYAELAAQWGGYFVPKSEIEVSTPIGDMSTEQLLARAAQLAQQIKGNGGAAERSQG